MASLRNAAFFLLAVAAAGCGGSKSPPQAESAAEAPRQTAQASADDSTDRATTSDAAAQGTDAQDDDDAQEKTAQPARAEPDATVEGAEEPEPATVKRFLLFAPGGPLVVDVMLSIDGRAADWHMEQLVAQVLEAADTDENGTVTWEEATNSPNLIYGQFGNAPMPSPRARREVIRRCDFNRNAVLDSEEVPRLLTQAGAATEVFSFTSAARLARNNCWEWLNTVKDGVLTAEELAAAPARLRSRDGDDNEMLVAAELGDVMQMVMRQPNRRRGRELAVMLDAATNWGTLQVRLEDGYGNPLRAESFSLVPELFGRLDADGDDWLAEEELAALTERPAHLELALTFGAWEEPEAGVSLKLNRVGDALAEKVAVLWERNDAVSLRLPSGKLAFSVRDAPGGNAEEAIKRQFDAYDNDANGYLDASEAEAARAFFMAPFEAADLDDDGKIHLEEAAAYQRQRQAVQGCRVQGTVAETEDALFSALDADDDGRLGAREIAAAEQRLRSFDTDRDGRIIANEVPSGYTVQFTRGNAPMGMVVRADAYASPVPAAPDAPQWFTAMDVNADGDVSPREFLGTSEQFQQLDVNADGFLDPDEIND